MRGLFLIFPATALAVAGYVVLYFANHSQGMMKAAGKWLGGWTMLLGAVVLLAGLTAPIFGGRPLGMGMSDQDRIERRAMMRERMMERGMGTPAPAPATAQPDANQPKYD